MIPVSYVPPTAEHSDTSGGRDYLIDLGAKKIVGAAEGENALRQAIRLRLLTDRGVYPVFSQTYGLPFAELGQTEGDVYFVQIKNHITETLLCDSRVRAVDSFEFSRIDRNSVHVSFRVLTQSGSFIQEADI